MARSSDIGYSGSAAGQRFHMEFVALRNQVRTAAGISPSRSISLGSAGTLELGGRSAQVVQRELKAFGEQVVLPTFRAFAPVSEGQEHELLRDTLRIIGRDKSSLAEIRLSMGWWGKLTSEGRSGLGTKPVGKAFKIILPGGNVIFRRSVGPATRRAFSSGELAPWDRNSRGLRADTDNRKYHAAQTYSKPDGAAFPPISSTVARQRMDWGKDAWRTIKESGAMDILARNMAESLITNPTTKLAFSKVAIAFASLDTLAAGAGSVEVAMRRMLGSFSNHSTEMFRNIEVAPGSMGRQVATGPGRGKYSHVHQAEATKRAAALKSRMESAQKRARDAYDRHVRQENRRSAKVRAQHGLNKPLVHEPTEAELAHQANRARAEMDKRLNHLMKEMHQTQQEINATTGLVHANWMSRRHLKRPTVDLVTSHDTRPGGIARQVIRHRAELKNKAAKLRAEIKRLVEDSNLP